MNKRGQLGDILEFKVGLVILILLIILSVMLFNVSSVVNFFSGDKQLSVSEKILSLQEEKIYQDLLINYLKKENLGDLIASKNLENADKILEKDNLYYLFVLYYDEDAEVSELPLNHIYIENLGSKEEFFSDALTRTIIPAFDGKNIIEIGLMEIEDE